MATLICDTECYKNYWLCIFYDPIKDRSIKLELYDGCELNIDRLETIMRSHKIITFNGQRYDLPMIYGAIAGLTNYQLKCMSDDIILTNAMWWLMSDKYDFTIRKTNHIDIINCLIGTASLKLYGARIHFPKLQELPIDPSASIHTKGREILRYYCLNDCKVTFALFDHLIKENQLRVDLSRKYNIDLRSKSDAQIAEAVIKHEYTRLTGKMIPKPTVKRAYKYRAPYFISFDSPELKGLLAEIEEMDFRIKPGSGAVICPKELNKRMVTIGKTKYRMGIGGLHAANKKEKHITDDEYQVLSIDVTSYYPNIILNARFFPKHIGPIFLDIFGGIVKDRLAAKKAKDEAEAKLLKIVVNGTFGKFGNRYSAVYAPDLMFHTTVTGQLALLMLIEQLESYNLHVVSANTDGLELRVPKTEMNILKNVISDWESDTGFVMEYINYKSIHYEHCNSYIALTEDDEMKCKGIFTTDDIGKNIVNTVCVNAVKALIKDGIPIEETINGCENINDFITIRTVRGGAVKDGVPIGKAIRWYYSDDTETPINYKKNGNKVPKSDGAVPLMDLCDGIPYDLDYDWYINETNKMLTKIGYYND